MTVTTHGRTFALEVRGPLRDRWNAVDRDADEKANTDLIARLLTDKDAVARMARGEVVTIQLAEGLRQDFRFSLPEETSAVMDELRRTSRVTGIPLATVPSGVKTPDGEQHG